MFAWSAHHDAAASSGHELPQAIASHLLEPADLQLNPTAHPQGTEGDVKASEAACSDALTGTDASPFGAAVYGFAPAPTGGARASEVLSRPASEGCREPASGK